jgi:hypothetical protein
MTHATIVLDETPLGVWLRDLKIADTMHNAVARLLQAIRPS